MAEESVVSREQRLDRGSSGPDPSSLTTATVQREIAQLGERVDLKIEGVVREIQAELKAIHLATATFQENLVRFPTEVTKSVGNLAAVQDEKFDSIERQFIERDVRVESSARDTRVAVDAALQAAKEAVGNNQRLHDEKFHSIEKQFQERDVRTEQTSRDSKVAVDAALQAAKEAVAEQNRSSALAIAKSETATAKSIDQLGLTVTTMTKGLEDKIEDIKERQTRYEGRLMGQVETKSESHSNSGMIISFVAIGLAVLTFLSRFLDFGGKP